MCGRASIETGTGSSFMMVSNVENRQRRDLYIRGAIRSRICPRGMTLRSLGDANRCTRTFYCIASLYFITFPLSLFFLFSLFLSPTTFWPTLNLLRLIVYILFVRSLCSDFITRMRLYIRTYACLRNVTHAATLVDF